MLHRLSRPVTTVFISKPAVTNHHKLGELEIYPHTVLEVRILKLVSLGQSEGVSRAGPLRRL